MIIFILLAQLCALKLTEGQVRFAVIGSWGGELTSFGLPPSPQINTAQAMLDVSVTNPLNGVISAGNNFYPSGVSSPTDSRFNTSWANVYDPSLGNWHLVGGAVDYDYDYNSGLIYNEIAYMDDRWVFPSQYSVSSFDDGSGVNVRTVFLDTTGIMDGGCSDSAQSDFLDWTTNAVEGITWMIYVMGDCPYSAGVSGPTNSKLTDFLAPTKNTGLVPIYICSQELNQQLIHPRTNDSFFIVQGAGGGALTAGSFQSETWLAQNGFQFLVMQAYGFNIMEFYTDRAIIYYYDNLDPPNLLIPPITLYAN